MSLTSGNFVLPPVSNEPSVRPAPALSLVADDVLHRLTISRALPTPLLQVEYYPGSPERASLDAAIAEMKASMPFEVPCVVDGKEVSLPRPL